MHTGSSAAGAGRFGMDMTCSLGSIVASLLFDSLFNTGDQYGTSGALPGDNCLAGTKKAYRCDPRDHEDFNIFAARLRANRSAAPIRRTALRGMGAVSRSIDPGGRAFRTGRIQRHHGAPDLAGVEQGARAAGHR